jgi:hypothetical protein
MSQRSSVAAEMQCLGRGRTEALKISDSASVQCCSHIQHLQVLTQPEEAMPLTKMPFKFVSPSS